jgi:hypothetical protein
VKGRLDQIITWIRKRPSRSAGIAVLVLVAGFAVSVIAKTPRLERDWVEHLAVMPTIDVREDGFALGPATDWTYAPAGPTAKSTVDFEARFADLQNLWFMVEPQPGGDYAAHTLVLFEFSDDRIIGVTVEARREADEDYDAFEGLFNKFELAYIWSTSKELLTRRAVFLNKDIFVYPLALNEEQKQGFLRSMLDQTIDVSQRPRFYNTLTSNCTNELAKAAKLDWHYSWVLTGYSPQRLFDLELIPGDDLAAVRQQAKLDTEIRGWNDLPSADFDRALLAELHRRFVGAGPGPQS